MNSELWNKVLNFNLDNQEGEYSFSIRLAYENKWTVNFTSEAIIEYKKFMYLAAVSNVMVSPSEIIDIVWHQHLIYTESYTEFCNLLGKQIQHIPSTHLPSEKDKYKIAKERTLMLYQNEFGPAPFQYWNYKNQFDILNLGKAKIKIRTFLLWGILSFALLAIPSYIFLKPIYSQINSIIFIATIVLFFIFTLLILGFFNYKKLKTMVENIDKNSFLFKLQPDEMIYMKSLNIIDVINTNINELLKQEKIKVNINKEIEFLENCESTNTLHQQIINEIKHYDNIKYSYLIKKLQIKKSFLNIQNSVDAINKYFLKSKKFASLFYTNFIAISLIILLSFTRIITGISRDKPVVFISIITILLCIFGIAFLYRLCYITIQKVIPDLYRNNIIPKDDTNWDNFIKGEAMFAPILILAINQHKNQSNSENYSSCSSGCGSSCSSCGGCGGD